jgi:hypothetical protein
MEPNRHGWTVVCCGLLLLGVVGLVLPHFSAGTPRWIVEARDYISLVLVIGGSAGAFLSLSPLRNVRVPLPRGRSQVTDDLLDARTLSSDRPPDAKDDDPDSRR